MTEYDDCAFCGGRVQERLVTKDCWWGDQLVAIIENVPAGVCDQCGERYYKANTLKEIQVILEKNRPPGPLKSTSSPLNQGNLI